MLANHLLRLHFCVVDQREILAHDSGIDTTFQTASENFVEPLGS